MYDMKLSFTDKQVIRAIFILNTASDPKIIKEKDRIITNLMNNIMTGRFEFKKGNTLASLAEALLENADGVFQGSQRPHYDSLVGNNVYYPITEVFSLGSA
jgi:hypothetical protein